MMMMEEAMKNNSRDIEGEQKFELPPGFRFHPTDEELITHYLSQKVLDSCFCARAIGEADLNKCEPWDLPWRAKMGEKEWYFFCVRDRKYPTGLRTNRATDAGYWKATGKDKEIYRAKALIGMKKTLVFYKGRAPKGEKTNWVMHEYRLEDKHHSMHNLPKRAMNEWAICRVFEKGSCGGKKMHVPELVRFNSSFGKELPPFMDDSSPPHNNNNSETKTTVGESSHETCFSEDQRTQQDDNNNNNIVVDSFETPPILASSSCYSSINPSSDIFSPAPIVFHQTTTQEFGNSQCSDSFVVHDQQSMLRMLIENHGYSNSTKPRIQKAQERDFDADMSSSSLMMYNNNNNEMFQRSFGNNNNQEYSSASSVGHVDTTSCLWNF